MRVALLALLLGTAIGVLNHVAVLAGIFGAPPGYEPAYVIRNLDIPQYLTWSALAKDYWLLPDYHAPWQTEPALFQPMFVLLGKTGLPPIAANYVLQLLMYWLAAYALIEAARTFCHSRRQMLYAAIVAAGALPLKLTGWAVAKWIGAAAPVQMGLVYGLVEYTYETADGFFRGGLSDSFTLTFGTAVTLFAFTALARYIRTGDRRQFYYLCFLAFFGALLHPFEVFLTVAGAIWPLWKFKRPFDIPVLGIAGALGVVPYLVQTIRSTWLRDASDLAQWHMTSPAWVVLAFGLPALLIAWLMALRWSGEDSDDDVLQSWFLVSCLLPMVPAIPGAMHLFDGFAYCLGFLLVRKVSQDQLFTRHREKLRPVAWAWAGFTAAVLATTYLQVYQDAKLPDPPIGRPAIIATGERKMLDWMRLHLDREKLVLAPAEMAPWVAALPMVTMGSHDLFSITFENQRADGLKFYAGDESVIDRYGISYVVTEQRLAGRVPLHEEGNLAVYEFPGQRLKPYPGREALSGAKPKNGFRQWLFATLGAVPK